MYCDVCGLAGAQHGDGHPCRDPFAESIPATTLATPAIHRRAPLYWEFLTWLSLALSVAYIGSAVFRGALLLRDYHMVQRIAAAPERLDLAAVRRLVSLEHLASTWYILLTIGYLGAYIGWGVVSGRLVKAHGGDPRQVLRHWTLVAWRLTFIVTIVLSLTLRGGSSNATTDGLSVDTLLGRDRAALMVVGLRIAVAGLLISGVWVLARRVRAVVAASTVPPRPHELPAQPPSPVTGPLAPPAGVRPADDAFWAEVAGMVERGDGQLPALEVRPSTNTRQWHLLAPGPVVAAVRAGLRPGAFLTVYPQPPRTVNAQTIAEIREQAGRLVRDGGSAVGLAVTSDTPVPRLTRLTSEHQVSFWLDRARTALRLGVYPLDPADDSGALRAAVT